MKEYIHVFVADEIKTTLLIRFFQIGEISAGQWGL